MDDLGIITPLRRVFALAVRRGYLADNPMLRFITKSCPRARRSTRRGHSLPPEFQRLLDAAPAVPAAARVAVYTGMSIQEILGLVWGDIDFRERVIRVRAQLSRGTKSQPGATCRSEDEGGSRDIALPRELEPYLREHLRETERRGLPRPDAFVFTTANGTPLNRNNVAKRGLDNAASDAGLNGDGVPKLGFHDLRHTFASHLIRAASIPFEHRASSAMHDRASLSTSTPTSSITRVDSTTSGIRSTPRSGEANLTKSDQSAKREGSEQSEPSSLPVNGLFKPFREVERAGLEPATPSLQSWCSPN